MKIGKYELIEKIGQGKFGQVFKGTNIKTGEMVAIKLERNSEINVLRHETTLLNYLYSKSCRNIPPVYLYGKIDVYSYLIMPFYDQHMDPAMDHKPLMRSAIQILKSIHGHSVLHRDIKPDNWMIRGNEMVLIDFGLARFYLDDTVDENPINTTTHRDNTHIIGTPKYVSIRIHEGFEYRCRDDLISLAYVGIGLAKGSFDQLWGSIPYFGNTNYAKTDILHPTNQYLFESKCLSQVSKNTIGHHELSKYIETVYSLKYDETPDYSYLAELFV